MRKLTLLALVLCGVAATVASAAVGGFDPFGTEKVGHQDAQGKLLPTNQRITPYGKATTITNGRLLSSALSPDGKRVAAYSWHDFTGFLTIFDGKLGNVLQQVGTGGAGDPSSVTARSLLTGLTAPPTARRCGCRRPRTCCGSASTPTAPSPPRRGDPARRGHEPRPPVRHRESRRTTRRSTSPSTGPTPLGVIDVASNKLTSQIPVGIAPRQLVWAHDRLFVSNEGGRPTKPGDVTNLTDNTPVVSDPVTGAVDNGTLSVVDPVAGKQTSTIKVGLEPTALKVSGDTIFVANSNGDSISVVNAISRTVKQTFNVAPLPGSTVGSNPNAIELTPNGNLLVSIGRDNALAVYKFNGESAPRAVPGPDPDRLLPGQRPVQRRVRAAGRHQRQGHRLARPGSTINAGPNANVVTGHNTYDDTGSITRFAPPTAGGPRLADPPGLREQRLGKLLSQPLGASKAAPVAIPVKLGDPSTIKHVFLIVKENRTYDQVLGDIGKGNTDPTLAQFGPASRPTSTPWPTSTACSTTSTTRAPCRRTATTG